MKIKFKDYTIPKYIELGSFSEGLAPVMNYKKKVGYIDKQFNEVIPCQFTWGKEFSEGLASVCNEDLRYGFIDKKGNIVVPFKYQMTSPFKEKRAAVQNEQGLWGYIDEEGQEIIPPKYASAESFNEEKAVVVINGGKAMIATKKRNATNGTPDDFEFQYQGKKISRFSDGFAFIKTLSGEYITIDKDFKIIKRKNIRSSLIDNAEGLILFRNELGKYGFYNKNLEEKIPAIFDSAEAFCEGLAIVEIGEDVTGLIGFVDKSGKITAFSTDRFNIIKPFSEGLAAVQSDRNGLWGFINKNGHEVIRCQYRKVFPFSNKVAKVITVDGIEKYIDAYNCPIFNISIPNVFISVLELDDKTIIIEAEDEEILAKKKMFVLEQLQEDMLRQVREALIDEQTIVMSDMFEARSRKKN